MALRWIDSFDHVKVAAGTAGLLSKYDSAESAATTFLSDAGGGLTARTGPDAIGLATFEKLVTKPLAVSGTTAILGVAIYVPAASLTTAQVVPVLGVHEGAIFHCGVGIDYSGGFGSAFKLTALRGTTVLATTTVTFPANSWLYVELKVLVHASAGTYEVRVDGASVLAATGVQTSNGGTAVWDRARIGSVWTGSVTMYFDDFYVCDGSGATRNDVLGPQRVESVLMVPGAGAHQEWTPLTGTDHGAMVDEAAPDGDTTYNIAIAAAQDTYLHAPLTLSGNINGVQVNPYWKKSDAGICTARTLVRASGTTYPGATQLPLTTYSVMPDVVEVNPASGLDWIAGTVNAAEFGAERLT